MLAAGKVAENAAAQPNVAVIRDFPEIRYLAGFPELPEPVAGGGQSAHVLVAAQRIKRFQVAHGVAANQAGPGRRRGEAGEEPVQTGEIQAVVAPDQAFDRIELVGFHGFDEVSGKVGTGAGAAERAVPHAAAGAAGDLGKFRRGEAARAVPVEFLQAGEGDMVYIHVQAHADGIRRDQKVDFLVLVERDLGISGARREAAHDNRAAAAAPADHFGDGVDFRGTEGDDRAACRQAHQLGRSRIGELGEARPRFDVGLGNQMREQRPDGFSTEEHCFDEAAGMQQTLGEHVSAIRIRAELDFIDREEFAGPVERHSFRGAGKPARARGYDLLLAGNEGNVLLTFGGHHAVVVFPREQPQREADHPGGVCEQTRHRQVGLAGVGGTENRLDAGGKHALGRFGRTPVDVPPIIQSTASARITCAGLRCVQQDSGRDAGHGA